MEKTELRNQSSKPSLDEERIISLLRRNIPVEGDEWTYLWRLTVRPGSEAFEHDHSGWTACYYVDVGNGGGDLILNGERFSPKNGDIVVIPPGCPHSVEKNTGDVDRISYALTVNPGDNRRVRKDVVR